MKKSKNSDSTKRGLGRLSGRVAINDRVKNLSEIIEGRDKDWFNTDNGIQGIINELEAISQNYEGFAVGLSRTDNEEKAYFETVRNWIKTLR